MAYGLGINVLKPVLTSETTFSVIGACLLGLPRRITRPSKSLSDAMTCAYEFAKAYSRLAVLSPEGLPQNRPDRLRIWSELKLDLSTLYAAHPDTVRSIDQFSYPPLLELPLSNHARVDVSSMESHRMIRHPLTPAGPYLEAAKG